VDCGVIFTCREVVADSVHRVVVGTTQDSVGPALLSCTSNSLAALPDNLREVEEVGPRCGWAVLTEWELIDLTIVPALGDCIGKSVGRLGDTGGATIGSDVLAVVHGTFGPVLPLALIS
jgi:hypothetical protein